MGTLMTLLLDPRFSEAHTSRTSSVLTSGLAAVLVATLLTQTGWPAVLAANMQGGNRLSREPNMMPSTYQASEVSRLSSQDDRLTYAMSNVFLLLSSQQIKLDDEAERALLRNLWDLY
jgi:hypothetical protein